MSGDDGEAIDARDAVCLTGLQRSFAEIQGNLRVS
tara:strand:- start:840 stop:944 length:105 start_codon:yes stop_codon:yes gene_type:complete